ncbi:MAG TPA: amidohydrolase [Acholeplasmataceae bacterium]|nr:MAG: amidohydrolase [Tenericutes bacterium GWA2_38_26]OHE30180.1 MAG: amidohydrolase [Tenericutes bacterium GWC2_39_45]OHE31389.1 MAG: amidohydrolase [Tenericutes bacterium GWD2_38_27]OHE42546.1 MAG: amidohydrolase [Tenericutes bacterium GWF2_38_8]HBG32866.1 amidohydrolase [Acholeplasmataceae bacterium]
MEKKMIDEKLAQFRKDLHQIPELAFDLYETHAYVKKTLEMMGYLTETVAKTGLIAQKKGKLEDSIAFRSDMDALPVAEMTKMEFPSKHPGKMHACGHDGHMSMLLGFAGLIAEMELKRESIVFIFQPAEEGPGGAKIIIEQGIFEKYHIKKIFGIHLYPELEEGLYGLVNGPMMAQNGEFNLKIKGKSAHGAQPHMAIDAILAASQLINQYHTIVSRSIDPLDTAVLTVGTVEAGEARNIIAKEAYITGTIRSFNNEVYGIIKKRMREIDAGISKSFQVEIDNLIMDYYPPVINDKSLFSMLKSSLNENKYKLIKPMMFAEDFAFYQQKVPGMFVMLGTRNEEKGFVHPLHSCYFNFDEIVLSKGVELYLHICKILNVI